MGSRYLNEDESVINVEALRFDTEDEARKVLATTRHNWSNVQELPKGVRVMLIQGRHHLVAWYKDDRQDRVTTVQLFGLFIPNWEGPTIKREWVRDEQA